MSLFLFNYTIFDMPKAWILKHSPVFHTRIILLFRPVLFKSDTENIIQP